MLEQATVLQGPRSGWPTSLKGAMSTERNVYGDLVKPMALAVNGAGSAKLAQAAVAIKVLRIAGHRGAAAFRTQPYC